jgi:predicted ATPase
MKLKSITLSGYKSINQEGATISFGDITVLLGANGVGKSNIVSFFSMLNAMMSKNWYRYVAEQGSADSFLYFGSKTTPEMELKIEFWDSEFIEIQTIILFPATRGELRASNHRIITRELNNGLEVSNEFSQYIIPNVNIQGFKVYDFQDTSVNSKIRGQGYISDNQYLQNDGSNLAAFLYRLKENPDSTKHYDKIVRYVQKAMPQFGNFSLEPSAINYRYITLDWREKNNSSYLFGPHQISDGSLRFMALATLLLQPEELLPKVIVLDEPELGLHPSALGYLAGMIKAASKHCQVIIATQSQRLVDEFEVENIVVVERNKITNNTEFIRKTEAELGDWLDQYSLGELWEKNVIGGQP